MTREVHTISVTGAGNFGAYFHLHCDTPNICKANDEGECNIQTWWEEVGIELVDSDELKGPPPWYVFTEYDGPDGEPSLSQIKADS